MENNSSANVDFIDGQMVNLDNMSTEQLKEMRAKLEEKEAKLLEKINGQLKVNEQLDTEDEYDK